MIDVRPVKRYAAPRYPTKQMTLADAELLARHLPPSWRMSRTIAGAVALLLAASGCSDTRGQRPAEVCAPTASKVAARAAPPDRVAALVAPIFEHGEGRGSTGCVVINPPVFLSEEEALQVIREELGRHGVRLGRGLALDQVTFRDGDKRVPLVTDGVDARRGIAVEYVSEQDADVLVDRDGEDLYFSSVRGYALKRVAHGLAARLRQSELQGMRFGTFYDPVGQMGRMERWSERYEWDFEERRAAARSRLKLRAQVVDFVHWLVGQGAI